jgi:hypothetical protein
MQGKEDYLTGEELNPLLEELVAAARQMDRIRMRDVLIRAVPEYQPHSEIEDLAWDESRANAEEAQQKVVNLNPGSSVRSLTNTPDSD